jgi:SAM-dependent methyltransferase
MVGKLFFSLQYWLTNPPWDTGITPPEVYEYLENNPPGSALDLGCGTGTNALTIASYGWRVTGVDFVPRAIRIAQRKSRRLKMDRQASFLVGDVLKPGFVDGKFELILDIGCFHSFQGERVKSYVENISGLLKDGGSLLIYVHLNENPSAGHGATESDLNLLMDYFTLINRQDGEESERPSAWLEFKK